MLTISILLIIIIMVRTDTGGEVVTWQQRTERGDIPNSFDDPLAGGIGHWIPEPKAALKKNDQNQN